MAKHEVQEPFWIYPGERRPVVVQAKNKRHAEHKVRESSEYDGFPVFCYTVEEYNKRCKSGQKTQEPVIKKDPDEELALFIGIKVVEGVVNKVFIAPTKKMVIEEADKLGQHLSAKTDALLVYHVPLPDDLEGAPEPTAPVEAKFFYKPVLKGEEKAKEAGEISKGVRVISPDGASISFDGGHTWMKLVNP